MKIYTKTGDKGETSLLTGKRVSKDHPSIEAYGTVDELIAFTAMVRDLIDMQDIKNNLGTIQGDLMVCSAMLASENESNNYDIPKLSEKAIVWLEKEIDKMEAELPVLKRFIIPGGHPAVSMIHVARTVCRRAERRVSSLRGIPEMIIKYLNRLSDYLFVLSRYISHCLGVREITWQPNLDK